MGWETRNGKSYYYRKVWSNGTCRSEYIQAGLSEIIGQLDRLEIEHRQWERHKRRQELEQLTGLDGPIDEFCQVVKQVTETVLSITGHYKYKRQWRKKRMDKSELRAMIKRVDKDKATKEDLAFLTKFIQETPNGLTVFGGDMYSNAMKSTLKALGGESQSGQLLVASLEQRLKELRADFGYESASAIEKLLIEQICINWTRVWWLETLFSQNSSGMTLATSLHYEKRLTLSQNRLNRAIETLARVRRLARRTPEILQVNIGTQQVNQVTI